MTSPTHGIGDRDQARIVGCALATLVRDATELLDRGVVTEPLRVPLLVVVKAACILHEKTRGVDPAVALIDGPPAPSPRASDPADWEIGGIAPRPPPDPAAAARGAGPSGRQK